MDETEWIELVAERLGIELTTYRPRPSDLSRLDTWMRLFDGPIPTLWFDEISESFERATALGRRTVLTGEFAEYVIEMRAGLVDHMVSHGQWRGALRFLAAKRRGGASWRTVTRQLGAAVVPEPLLAAYRRRHSDFDGLRRAEWVDPDRVDQSSPTLRYGRRHQWRRSQLTAYHGPGISLEADEFLQASAGITVRRPWLDVDLWEYWLSLRAEDKFPESRYKGAVKRLLRGRVPDEVLDRRSFTTFDDDIMTKVDYAGLRHWLLDPGWQLPGVDYARLRARVEAQDLNLFEYIWARDLAAVHAFVEGECG